MLTATRTVIRRDGGLYALERALQRRGFTWVAGADEAGRGACAGPLVVAAAILPPGRAGEVPGLADSKLLTPAARERVYTEVLARVLAYAVVVIPSTEVDGRGLHVCNLSGMRRALAGLAVRPDYALTDGFRVDGLGVPGLGVWKGDQVAACVAAASVLAKVHRDRIMVDLDGEFPAYGFADHKGYATPDHADALRRHGPCPQHRFSYANVAAAELGVAATELGVAEMGVTQLGAAKLGVTALGSAAQDVVQAIRGTVSVAPGTATGPDAPLGENVGGMEGDWR